MKKMEELQEIKITPLEEALAYSNEMIIFKFLESYNITFEEAEDLFTETKRWLWLCAKVRHDRSNGIEVPTLSIHKELGFLDEMWHTFILFTKDYFSFCKENFGYYIHHAPTTKNEKDYYKNALKRDPVEFENNITKEYDLHYSYIFDNLGRDTLVKWYYIYPKKYTRSFIRSVRN